MKRKTSSALRLKRILEPDQEEARRDIRRALKLAFDAGDLDSYRRLLGLQRENRRLRFEASTLQMVREKLAGEAR